MKKNMTMSSIRLRGHKALYAALGPVGFIRFMQQFVSRGDYTKDREKWIDKIDLSDIGTRATPVPGKQKRRASR
jgi:hypothetical protein